MKLRPTSIRGRLVAMSTLAGGFAVLLACSAFLTYEFATFRKSLVDELTAHARVLAFNLTSPLLFDDPETATTALASLKAMPTITKATLTRPDGTTFAAYGEPSTRPLATQPPTDAVAAYRFEDRGLLLSVPVLSDGSNIGTLTLESSLDDVARRLRRYLLLTAGVLLLSIVAALGMSRWFQRRLLRPILDLTRAARRVSEKGDYSVRVAPSSDDELGSLMTTFNDMLGKIEEQNEALSREGEQRFRLLVDGVKDYAIIMLDLDGRIETWNAGAARLLGYSAQEITGKNFRCFYTDTDVAARGPERELERAFKEGHAEDEGWRLRKDGSRFWADVVVTPVVDPTGARHGFAKVVRDMTERRQTENALREAKLAAEASNRELEAFSYSVAHDLRAPLRSIDGFSQAALEVAGDSLGPEGAGFLRRVRAASQRMALLIDGLLSLSRLTRADFRRQPVDLSALAASVATELRAANPERHVTLEIAEGLTAEGDPLLLRVVLSNLLGNAWKFSSKREDALIEFSNSQQDGETVFQVRDNGAGFDMSYAKRLFGIFQRLHRAEEFEGTGVGLSTVQRVVQRHGGRIWAEAEVGKGATFFFTLK
jgi:PAS domain S-box-containing protein